MEPQAKSSRILLVEDDRSLRRYLEIFLKRAGYEVVSASDGIEAIRMLSSSNVDIIMTDAIMPNLSGYELSRFLKNTSRLAHIPIILLSALEPDKGQQADHIDAFLIKPFSNKDLLNCLSNLLSQRRDK